ncbi:MAG: ferritin family protein [Deltaproteobacteria bacterium]|nr:ferritin family protein [Deltaproteobacteria bacterium]
MNKTTRQILEGMKKAMQGERTGHEFYKMAAKSTKDPMGRQVFEELAREEAEHFSFLARQYDSFLEAGHLDPKVKLGKPMPLDRGHPIFSPAFKKRLKDAHFEMSALAVAVQLELNGINHYRAEANRARDPDLKRFYEQLVRWEIGHYEAFLRQQQELQEQYWAEAGFAPF